MKLTASTINALTKPGRYSDGRNLYLNVSKTGAKSWLFIYRAINGKQRELGLGSYTGAGAAFSVGLAAARLAADAVRVQLAGGLDPIEQKIAQRVAAAVSSVTFGDLLDDLITIMRRDWKVRADGTYKQEDVWRSSFAHHAPALLKKRVALVTEQTVVDILQPIWATKGPTASNLLYRINKVMELAIARKLHAGPNPGRYDGHIEIVVGKKASKMSATGGHAQLHYDDLPALWTELMADTGMRTKALAFVILTAVRTDEARLMQWSEIDFAKKRWTVPVERMKMGKAHVVPLSEQAIALLRSIPQVAGNPFVFTGQKAGSSVGSSALADRLGDAKSEGGLGMLGKATVHGMRKTFRNWVGDKLRGYTEQDFEMCLAHSVGGVEGVYRTETALEKRAEIMQAWANYTTGQQADVIQLAA